MIRDESELMPWQIMKKRKKRKSKRKTEKRQMKMSNPLPKNDHKKTCRLGVGVSWLGQLITVNKVFSLKKKRASAC